jgi:DNA-binding Xre family transcriptional regulator
MSYKNVTLLKSNSQIVLEKYNSKCAMCGNDYDQIHHIDRTTTNHETENLLPLCIKCHALIHQQNRVKGNSNKINSEFIKKGILEMGLNRKEFSKLLGVTPSSLSIMLKRETTHVRTIRKLSEILKCKITDILQLDANLSSLNKEQCFYLTINLNNEDYLKVLRHSLASSVEPELILKGLLRNAVKKLGEPIILKPKQGD